MSWFSSLTGAGKLLDTVGGIATEWIETNKETAEAKAIMVKTLDPNGQMRRELSRTASRLYVFYIIATTILIFVQAYGIGDKAAAEQAVSAMTDLFLPLTTAWGGIVTASFGINGLNTHGENRND